jgi:UDP-glucuronate 4-epimerase
MILVTGAAGFIGFHIAQRLLNDGQTVHAIDNLNDYYDPKLKEGRLKLLKSHRNFTFHHVNIAHQDSVAAIFTSHRPEFVIHLAAQAGVRHSIKNPTAYIDSNISGFLHILEGCRHNGVKHLVYASSSSVYGLNGTMPLSIHQSAEHPVSLYGATKKANELMAHSYSHLYNIPTTGLRFFTVYGPWGRPDMAYFLFTKAILEGRQIDVYNDGKMKRDFTYVDDVVEGVIRILKRSAQPDKQWDNNNPDPASSSAPYRIFNVGNHSSIDILRFIEVVEDCLGKKAIKRFLPAQPGDVLATTAEVADLLRYTGFEPKTPLDLGMRHFTDWYRTYIVK